MTSQERKIQTETVLKNLDIEVNPFLPCIEEESEAKIREGKEIAKRILVLVYLNVLKDSENTEIVQFLKDEKLWEAVSNNEKELFIKDILTKKEQINISWRSEAVWLLLWAINKVAYLKLPIEQCSVSDILQTIPKFFEPTDKFVNSTSISR